MRRPLPAPDQTPLGTVVVQPLRSARVEVLPSQRARLRLRRVRQALQRQARLSTSRRAQVRRLARAVALTRPPAAAWAQAVARVASTVGSLRMVLVPELAAWPPASEAAAQTLPTVAAVQTVSARARAVVALQPMPVRQGPARRRPRPRLAGPA